MARPGFVHEVDTRTPPLLIPTGDTFRLERLPLGTQVVYPPEALPALPDVEAAIDEALGQPLGSDPLADRLRAGMKLTIAFDDVTVPAPRMRRPDIRGRIIEKVLGLAAAAGVDDVELLVGNGLQRRITQAEMLHLLGERVFRSFFADGRLNNHDATDVHGSINARAAESDLLVYVHVTVSPLGNGVAAVLKGLGPAELLLERGGLDAVRSGQTEPVPEWGTLPPIFSVEAVLDNNAFPTGLDFLAKREWEWSLRDRMTSSAVMRALELAPAKARRRLVNSAEASFGVIQVRAGDPGAVAEASASKVRQQQLVEVKGQADVMITGVGQHSPYSADSVLNPILAAWMALGHTFAAHTGLPVVREGGALIVYHPAVNEFSSLHHPSYVDFFADVLSAGTDATEVRDTFQAKYAEDAWYAHLYRSGNAYHGAHPFLLWYQLSRAVEHCGDIIWVGADIATVERLGFRSASTLHDALEIVAPTVGRTPKISYLHQPTHLIADVR
ncbi:lactate racemase domain-containing protein [Microlunatus panaciterrae]|uniref:LarA-like N-terminal domain-containing protein n=1 Tax=Microlunatus panaciterrae TaxID=400768 RepID=A0ABS2RE70_9ACTN|nr:lactate racemase domain-containing protein [Microlunatus panaciterrae]MBM7797294.1 hypothetical protein [Microlunatus panaciterrae]